MKGEGVERTLGWGGGAGPSLIWSKGKEKWQYLGKITIIRLERGRIR